MPLSSHLPGRPIPLPEPPIEPSKTTLNPAKKLNLLFQHSPLAIIEWESDFTIVSWNPAAAELFNFFEDEALGQRLDSLLAQRQMAELEANSWTSCENKGVLLEHVNLTGKQLCRWFNTPFIVKGQQVGTLSTIVNTTHQTALSNEELRSQLQSRTRVLKHTTARLQSAMNDRAQTYVALRESETRFQNLAKNVPGVLYQFCQRADGSYAIPYISSACQDVYELTAEEITTAPDRLMAMIEPDDRRALETALEKSARTLTPWNSEHRICTPSGQQKWVQLASQPQPELTGNAQSGTLWSGVLIDITDRKQAEQQRADSHAFLHNLINGISDPIFVKDESHALILLNDAYCEFAGRSREELLSQKEHNAVSSAVSEGKVQEIWQNDNHVLSSGLSCTYEEYFTDKTDQLKFISTTKTRFYSFDKKPYLLGIIRDLTEKAIAQKALTESEKQLKNLTANVPGVLYQFRLDTDLKASFSFVSPSCQSLFELSPAQLQADANSLLSLIHPDDQASFDHSIGLSVQTLNDWHWQGRFTLASGRLLWIKGESRPERLPDGSILWDGILMDITELKQAEHGLQKTELRLRKQTQQLKTTLGALKQTQSKLIQSEKMSSLGQLVAGIAHEINNPVSFIHGNLTHAQGYIQDMVKMLRLYQAHYPVPIAEIKTLTEELELDYIVSDLPKLLNSIKLGTERIRNIVLSLRNFSRLDESELKQADLQEGLESALMILNARLKATDSRHDIEVVKAYENIPPVECYAGQLNQIFMNILVNAIDAIDSAAVPDKIYQIVLQTFQKESQVVVRMTNNGPPIPADVAQRMFDPFYTTKPVGTGTGMGLAISYQTIVDLHKGSLEYSQTADGKTVFTIAIPLAPAAQLTA